MGISPFQLLIVLLIVILVFGGKRLRNLGGDLGQAIKGFREATREEESPSPSQVIDGGKVERVQHAEGPAVNGEVERSQQETPKEP